MDLGLREELHDYILWEKNLGFSRMVHFFLLLSPIKAKRENVFMSQNLK